MKNKKLSLYPLLLVSFARARAFLRFQARRIRMFPKKTYATNMRCSAKYIRPKTV